MPVPVLRPLSVGEILDAALKILVRNFLTLAKSTAIVVLPAALIVAVIEGSLSTTTTTVINPNTGQIVTSDVRTIIGELSAVYAVTLIAALLASAIVYKVVGDAYVGGRPDWRVALRFTAQRVLSILWVSIVVFAYFGLVVVAGAIVIAVLAHFAPALGVLAGIGLVVVFIWLALPATLSVPTFMMEGRKGFRAYRRAFALVRGNWWRTFGLLLITGILSGVVTLIADLLFGGLLRAVLGGTTAGRILVEFLLFGVTYLCIQPFQGAVLVVLSIDLRVRKEGYDVELLASQLGVDASSVSLPYARYTTALQQPGYPGPGGFPSGAPPGYPQPGGYPPGSPPGAAPPGYLPPFAAPAPAGGPPAPPGPGWWMASDGHWYAPELNPSTRTAPPPGPGWWMASDGQWYPPERHPSAPPPEPGTPPGPASSG
jgi:hypothetical protein